MSVGEPGEHSAGRLSVCGQRAAGSLEHRIHRSATRKENWKKRERLDAPDRRQRVTPASIVVRRTSGVDRSDARQMASTLPHHVQHELGTQEQGPKTVRERELAGNHYVGRCRQTDRFSFVLDRFCVPAIEERGRQMASSRSFGADDPVAAWLTYGVWARRQRGGRCAGEGIRHAL
jgi:hypothetical protein